LRTIGEVALALALLWPCAAAAQQPTYNIDASVDRQEVAAGDRLRYSVRIQADGQAQMRMARTPRFGSLKVLQTQQGTEFRSINGRAQVAYNYHFTLQAGEQGQVTIEGGAAQVNGARVAIPPVKVKVLPPGKAPKNGGVSGNKGYRNGAMLLKSNLSTDAPYVGQQVQLSYDLLVDPLEVGPFGVDVRDVKTPSFDGFWMEDLSESVRASQGRRRLGRRTYTARAVQLLALFPLNTGTIEVEPLTMELSAAARFGARRELVRLASDPIKLKVRPLPSGAPAGFHKGNVGRYDFSVEVDKRQVSVGEPVTVRLTARGQGMVSRVQLPSVPRDDRWRLLEPVYHKEMGVVRDEVGGSKTAEVVLTPTQEGQLVLPSLQFHYFDPDLGRYKTLSSREQRISVIGKAAVVPDQEVKLVKRQSAQGGAVQTAQQPLRALKPLPEGQDRLRDPARQPWFWAGVALPGLLYLGWLLWGSLAARRLQSAPARRQKGAGKQAEAALAQAADASDAAACARQVHQALTGYLAARLDLAPGAVSRSRLGRLLPERGVQAEVTDRLLALMERCEQARFGDTEGVQPRALAQEAQALLKDLEGAL
jgi:hypothetical protein